MGQQDPPVAVEPRRPSKTNVGTETAFRHDHCKHFQKSKRLLRSEVSWCDQTRVHFQLHQSTCSASRISTQKEPFPSSEFMVALNLDILDAGRLPNAVWVHAGTTPVVFEVDRPPPADSPPGDLWITMVKETVILYKKSFEKKKTKLVRISHLIWKWWKRYWLRDSLWLCQACNCGFRPR